MLPIKIITAALALLLLAGEAFAAAFIKYDDGDGEAKSDARPTEEVAFYYNKISFSTSTRCSALR